MAGTASAYLYRWQGDLRGGHRLSTGACQSGDPWRGWAIPRTGRRRNRECPEYQYPPQCELPRASVPLLWPPDHKLIPVGIVGVTDPNNDAVTLTVTGVTQDEPLNGLGDGDTSPDAVLHGTEVLLRAERAGAGNGRVYRLSFTADDGLIIGGQCTGSVIVCVPHDRKTSTCVHDGLLFDSLTP